MKKVEYTEDYFNKQYYEYILLFAESVAYNKRNGDIYNNAELIDLSMEEITEFIALNNREFLTRFDNYILSIKEMILALYKKDNKVPLHTDKFFKSDFKEIIAKKGLTRRDIDVLVISDYFHILIKTIIKMHDLYKPTEEDNLKFAALCRHNISLIQFSELYKKLDGFYNNEQIIQAEETLSEAFSQIKNYYTAPNFNAIPSEVIKVALLRTEQRIGFTCFLSVLIEEAKSKELAPWEFHTLHEFAVELNVKLKQKVDGKLVYNIPTCYKLIDDVLSLYKDSKDKNIQRLRTERKGR